MKRLFAFMLAVMMLLSAVGSAEGAAAERVFVLREGVSWNSTPEDVLAVFPDARVEEMDGFVVDILGKITVMLVYDVPVSTTKASTMILLFLNEQLTFIDYEFLQTDEKALTPEEMFENLKLKYGAAESVDTLPLYKMMEAWMGEGAFAAENETMKDVCVWMADEDTRISFAVYKNSAEDVSGSKSMSIFYEYLPGWEIVQKAVDERTQRLFGL